MLIYIKQHVTNVPEKNKENRIYRIQKIINKTCEIKIKKDIIQNMCTRKNVLYIA